MTSSQKLKLYIDIQSFIFLISSSCKNFDKGNTKKRNKTYIKQQKQMYIIPFAVYPKH